MGSNSKAAGRSDLLLFEPDDLILVTDKKHPLYDPRVDMDLSESLVLNVMVHGVIEPVIVRRNGDKVEVVDGRQRVRAAREASKRLKREGKAPLRVPAVVKRGDDATVFGVMASTFIRQDESPLEQARKIQRYVDMGRTEEDAAITFGVSRSTIRVRLALLDAAPEVRRALESGKLSVVHAAKLTKLPRDEQAEALPALLKDDDGAPKKEKIRDAVPQTKQRMIGRTKLAKLLDAVECSPEPPSAADVLRFILGKGELEARWTEGL